LFERGMRPMQSDKISHIDIKDDGIDTIISHISNLYPMSISRMTISIWWMSVSIIHIPYRHTYGYPIPLMHDSPYRYLISISHIDIASYFVTLVLWLLMSHPCLSLGVVPGMPLTVRLDVAAQVGFESKNCEQMVF
jgi:hypothetical protein